MSLDGATGYDAVSANTAPGAAVTDFSLYVQFDPSASWWAAYEAAGSNPGKIRVARYDGAVEYARDVLVTPTADLVMLRVLWPGAQTGMPSLQVYPDATAVYGVSDTYGGYNAYDSYRVADIPYAVNTADRTANANDAAAGVGDPVTQAAGGKLLGYRDFDGNDADAIPYDASLALAGDFTIMAWINVPANTLGQSLSGRGSSPRNWQVYITTGGLFRLYVRDVSSNALAVDQNTAFGTGAWHHLACMRDAGSTGYIYYDGANDTNGTPTDNASGDVHTDGDDAIIGERYEANTTYCLTGGVCEFKVDATLRSPTWVNFEFTITNNPAGIWSDGGWTPVGGPAGHPAFARFANVPFCHGYRGGRVA